MRFSSLGQKVLGLTAVGCYTGLVDLRLGIQACRGLGFLSVGVVGFLVLLLFKVLLGFRIQLFLGWVLVA